MPIPPQFQKAANKKANEKLGLHGAHAKGPKRDSKDPKGAPFDAIPSGPMKGKNPNDFQHKGKKKHSNSKRDAMLAQLRGGK